MLYFALLALGLTIGVPIAAAGGALGQGRIGAAALEGMARQPEAAGRLQTSMIIGLAIIESLVIYALLTFFMLSGKLPDSQAVLDVVKTQPAAVAPR